MPRLFIIAGSNGAGKSTAGPDLLPPEIRTQYAPFDGDKLKMVKQKEFKIQTGSYKEAGRLAEKFVDRVFTNEYKKALAQRDHFVFEGHFSEETSWDLIRLFRDNGYLIDMIFLGLDSLQLSHDRVLNRAKNGGHNVPPYDIEKNFFGNLLMINAHIDLIDQLTLLDTSGSLPIYIGQWKEKRMDFNVDDTSIPEWVRKYLPRLL